MLLRMIKATCLTIACCIALSTMMLQPPSQSFAQEESLEIEIQISPHVLNLQKIGTIVTVHADISYNLVDTNTVALNDVPSIFCFPDDRGELVAKFKMKDIGDSIDPDGIGGENDFMLTGTTKEGDDFYGNESIKVIDKYKDQNGVDD